MDIYRARENKKGEWVNVRNLGPVINTQFDEEAVFISDDGKYLYFSSFGHYGMGDLDIYRAEWDEDSQSWKEPLNMGYPINSVENDIYFVISDDGKNGYFSSVKPIHNHFLNQSDSALFHELLKFSVNQHEDLDIKRESRIRLLNAMLDFYYMHNPAMGHVKSFEILKETFR